MPEPQIVTIPYSPRHPQGEIHKALETHRWNCLVAHRRLGKTILGINHLIKMAMKCPLENPQYAYIAPFRNQAKLIAFQFFKKYTAVLPDVHVDEAELYFGLPGNRRIHLFGADNVDALRGIFLDGVFIDETSQIKSSLFYETLRPALSDRYGWCVFSGTPRGINFFKEIYDTANKEIAAGNKDWWSGLYRADETSVIPAAELKELEEVMPPSIFRQEMLCDWSAASDNVLITIDLVTTAMARSYSQGDISGAARVMGIDVARFGDDKSVIFKRQGLQAFEPIVMSKINNMELADRVIHEIRAFRPDGVFCDAGRGEGVIDRVRQLGYKITEVNFGAISVEPQVYGNKRTEMWDSGRKWLEAGGALPLNRDLRSGLISPTYDFDPANRMRLMPKDKMREKYGKITGLDESDAFMVTFAYPVRAKKEWEFDFPRPKQSYDPYQSLTDPFQI